MFAAQAFTALLALAAPLLVRADVTPNEPGPGDSFNEGTMCHIAWLGDTQSTTAWKGMAIELMTGDNFNMIHITTVATNQDGTVAGMFDYPCPAVTPNSAIYFYQFSSPNTPVKTWTTRFTIASASGQSTPPANPTQPGTAAAIPWGVGNLVDPSKAVAAPSFGGGASAAPGSSSSVQDGPLTTTTSSASIPSPTPSMTTSSIASRSSSQSESASSDSSTPSASPSPSGTSGASALGFDARVSLSAAAIVFAALMW